MEIFRLEKFTITCILIILSKGVYNYDAFKVSYLTINNIPTSRKYKEIKISDMRFRNKTHTLTMNTDEKDS